MTPQLIIFDLDGTLVTPTSGGEFRKTADDWAYLPNVVNKCRTLREKGIRLAVATNQGGVAFGYYTEDAIHAEVEKAVQGIGAMTGRLCPEHPKGTIEKYARSSLDRKPMPGMLWSILGELAVLPKDALYVGDRDEDRQAASRANVAFEHAVDFFQGVERTPEEEEWEREARRLRLVGYYNKPRRA